LNHGSSPNALQALFLKCSHVDEDEGDPVMDRNVWRYGRNGQRNDITRDMWKYAQTIRISNPTEARDYARAALLFAAYNHFSELCVIMAYRIGQVDQKLFKEIADLTDKQSNTIMELCKKHSELNSGLYDKVKKYMLCVGDLSLIKKPDMPLRKVETAIKYLKLCQEQSEKKISSSWDLANVTWDLLNIARDRENKEAIAKVEAEIKTWRDRTTRPHLKRWLQESLDRVGPATEGHYIGQFDMDEDGKLKPIPPQVPPD
jgi:hypothetical protein